ncbi:MAG: hypothetical protein ACUVRJ_10790, partial [Candidatus Villigracilaceae bacterium]
NSGMVFAGDVLLQSKAMLIAALHNPNLSETERAAVKEHAPRRGLAAALGLLGGLAAAYAERMRKQEERAEQRAARLLCYNYPNMKFPL